MIMQSDSERNKNSPLFRQKNFNDFGSFGCLNQSNHNDPSVNESDH